MDANNKSTSYDATDFNSFGVDPIPKEIKKIMWKQKYDHKYL